MTDDSIEPLVFVRDEDTGAVTVREWLPMTIMSPQFLIHAHDTEAIVTFTVANGSRRYKIVNVSTSGILTLELQDA